jgi:DNA-damage-inducible protein J
MAKTTYVNTRIDPRLKSKAEKIFAGIGVSASQAITMFYRQVVLRRGMPFDVRIPNAETLAALKEADAGGGEIFVGPTAATFDEIASDIQTRRK